jgi:Tol biopolymer transport system component
MAQDVVQKVLTLALVLVIAGLSVPAVRHLREQPPPPPPALRLTLGAPSGTELGSGDETLDAAISPDGQQLVLVATDRAGTTSLWHRRLESDLSEPIRGTEGAQLPAWSPSAGEVLFFAAGRLRQIPLAGGAARDLAEAPSPSGAVSLADGSILFAPQSSGAIRRLFNGTVSDATTLRPGERGHVFPASAGEGGAFVYTSIDGSGRRTVHLVRDGEVRPLTVTSGHGLVVATRLLHVRDNVLLAQRVDEAGRLQGPAVPLARGVGVTSSGRGLFVASSRVLLSTGFAPRARELAWFDMRGTRTGTTGEPGPFWQVRLGPDDRHAAVTVLDPLLRTLDIDIIPTRPGEAVESLTLALAPDSDPVWSPDGRRVLFRSMQSGRPALVTKRAHDADAEEETVTGVERDATPSDWRGSTMLVHAVEPSSGSDIWTIDARTQASAALVKGGFNESDGRWSPDGDWIAYVSDESGRPDVYASRRGAERVRVSLAGGTRPRWSRDGRSVFFLRDSAIMRADLQPGSPARFTPAKPVVDLPGIRDFDVAHRQDALLALVPVKGAFPVPVSVVVDWQSALPPSP